MEAAAAEPALAWALVSVRAGVPVVAEVWAWARAAVWEPAQAEGLAEEPARALASAVVSAEVPVFFGVAGARSKASVPVVVLMAHEMAPVMWRVSGTSMEQ